MSIEPFLHAQVAPNLLPGERILGCGLLRRPRRVNAFGVPQEYEDHLGVATDRRLFVYETEVGGFLSPVAKPIAKSPIVWAYDELATVATDWVKGAVVHSGGRGRTLYLSAVPGLGPFPVRDPNDAHEVGLSGRRYDIYAVIEGLPAQTAFMEQFPAWLEAQHRSGALAPTGPRRQEIEQRLASIRAAADAERKRKETASAEARARRGPVLAKAGIGGGGGLLAVSGIALAIYGASDVSYRTEQIERYERTVASLESDLAWSRTSAPLPPDCPEQAEWFASPSFGRCHGCERALGASRTGWRRVSRGRDEYDCPPPAQREGTLSLARIDLGRAKTKRVTAIGSAFGGGVLLIAGALVALLGLRWYAKREDRRRAMP